MPKEPVADEVKSYLEDLKTIKALLIKVENTPLIEKWIFITWGIFILAGTLAHILLAHYLKIKLEDLAVEVWLPVLIIGGILEGIGMVRAIGKEALTLASPRVYRFYLNFFFTAVALIILCVIIGRLGMHAYLGSAILISYAILFFNFSLAGAYQHLFIFGLGAFFTSILLLIFLPPFLIQVLIVGIMIGGCMLLAGILKPGKE